VNGEILLWNPAAEAIFGYGEEEILGEPLSMLMPERFWEAHLDAFERRARGGDKTLLRQSEDVVGLRKDGSEFPAEISLSAGEYDGQPVFNAMLRDVSEQRVAQEALERLSRQHELLLNSAGEGIVGVDRGGIVSFANPASLALIGWPSHEVLGRSFHDLAHHSHEDGSPCPASECAALEALSTGEGTRGETVYWRRDGLPLPVAYSCTPIVEGNEVMGTVLVFEDITERREAERALRHSESKYRSLVEHATYGIYRSTPEGHFVSVNPALVEMLGYGSEEELLEAKLADEIYEDRGERAGLVAQYERAESIDAVDLRWRRRDGEPITVRVSGRPLHDEEGELVAFEMIAEDVTERRRLEEQLRQSQKMEAVGQLTGGIAHDFNNELSVILLNAELMARALESGEAVDGDDLEAIHEAAKRASRITRQLLGFSRQAELRMEATDLSQVVGGMSSMIRTVVPEMIDVRISADPSVSMVRVDAGVVEQILLNLVTNARDAMPTGGDLVIEVGEQEVEEAQAELYADVSPGRYVFITVSDTGIGMDRNVQARLFEPFFTTKPSGEGTGLGMAMVYGLTEQQDGYVHVYSEPGHGTTVRLGFPACVEAGPDGAAPEKHRELQGGSETILLVEDEPAVRGTARRVLERAGYHVVAAADGEEGLSLYRASPERFDLVLSDLVMPKMGGLQLYEALQEEWESVPFLLASGYAGREPEEGAPLDKSIPFVQKPWRLADLLERVRQVIDGDEGSAG
jgi:two-component system NtrC family sensor kinase